MPLIWHDITPVDDETESTSALKPFGVVCREDERSCIYYRERGTGILVKQIGTLYVYSDGRIVCWHRQDATEEERRIMLAEAEGQITGKKPRAADGWVRQRATKTKPSCWWATINVIAHDDDPMQRLVAVAKPELEIDRQLADLSLLDVAEAGQ